MRKAMRRARALGCACAVTALAALSAGQASATGTTPAIHGDDVRASAAAKARPTARKAAKARAKDRRAPRTRVHHASQEPGLSYSDEFDRAELVDEMLKECRGVPYNAYELALTSGEKLWLPAPIQLMVIRVKHPYCAELLREYSPRTPV
jgi:hypothetical protein